MFERIKERITHASKETVKETVRSHAPEIFAVTTVVLLAYLCVKVNGKPVNVTINLTGGAPWTY